MCLIKSVNAISLPMVSVITNECCKVYLPILYKISVAFWKGVKHIDLGSLSNIKIKIPQGLSIKKCKKGFVWY